MNNSRLRNIVVLIVTFSIWGSLYVISKYTMDKIPAFSVIFLRSAIAAIALFALLKISRTAKPVKKEDIKYYLLAGVVGYFLSVGLQTLGTKYTGAAMAALVNSLNPLVILMISAVFLKEKLTARRTCGIVLAVIGVYIILGGVQAGSQMAGVVMSLCSVLAWSIISIVNKQLSQRYSPIQVTAYGVAIATVLNVVPASLEWVASPPQFSWTVVLALIYMGVVCTGVAHMLWNWCLAREDANFCSAFYPLQPLVASLMGILFLHEDVTRNFMVGSIIVVVGFVISIMEPKKVKQ
ncbi:DMT family transporter [Lawsonibacter sp. LCP25S3_G6]|uniref:DMT family transporter n=1 Tax=unclassified Lawsonibacter TaxID=2617946 RepID=UPI003F9C4FDD